MKKKKSEFQKAEFQTHTEFFDYFKTDEFCKDYITKIRWKDGYRCPRCNKIQQPYFLKHGYKCSMADCGKKFSDLKGTIFENTKISLRNWLAAIYLTVSRTYGTSSAQLAKDLGITQKTSWFLLHRIRETFDIKYRKLKGIIEADETFLGGKTQNKRRNKRKDRTQGRSLVDKVVVFGALERGGLLRTRVVPDTTGETLKAAITDMVETQEMLITDEWKGYNWADLLYYHIRVRHKKSELVYKDVHLNGIEGAWANLKRRWAQMHSMDRKYLQRLVDEFVWSYNHRHLSVNEKFHSVLELACKKRISYKTLKASAPPVLNRETNFLYQIQKAIDTQKQLYIEYVDSKKEKTKRSVEPIGLAMNNGGWHMIAWCHLRHDYRDFRVLRIIKMEETGRAFRKTDLITLREYLKRLNLDYEATEYRQAA